MVRVFERCFFDPQKCKNGRLQHYYVQQLLKLSNANNVVPEFVPPSMLYEEIPGNIAVKQTPGSYDFVNGIATSEARYKMCGQHFRVQHTCFPVNFPQHGHTLHDTAFSLFVTMHEHNHLEP